MKSSSRSYNKMTPRSFKHCKQQQLRPKRQQQKFNADSNVNSYDPPSGIDPPMLKTSAAVRRSNSSKLPPPPPPLGIKAHSTRLQLPHPTVPSVASTTPRNSNRIRVEFQPSHVSVDPPSVTSFCKMKKSSSKFKCANNIISNNNIHENVGIRDNSNIFRNKANKFLHRQPDLLSRGHLQRYSSTPPPQIMPTGSHSLPRRAKSSHRHSINSIGDGSASKLRRRSPGDNSDSGDSTSSNKTSLTLWNTCSGQISRESSSRGSAHDDDAIEEGQALATMNEKNEGDLDSIGTDPFYKYRFGGYPKNGTRQKHCLVNHYEQYPVTCNTNEHFSSTSIRRQQSKSKPMQIRLTVSTYLLMIKVFFFSIVILIMCWVILLGLLSSGYGFEGIGPVECCEMKWPSAGSGETLNHIFMKGITRVVEILLGQKNELDVQSLPRKR